MPVTYNKGDHDTRPWGRWDVVETGDNYAVKKIHIAPGERLSLQVHAHRDEHWIITAGAGSVTIGNTTTPTGPNDHHFVPAGQSHFAENTGDVPLEFIEIQMGEHLDEEDNTRLFDPYGRD